MPILSNRPKESKGHPKGQTSLVMILVIAMAFIFYAISLNWGRLANEKTSTWMTATSAASQTASMFASWGERTMWENLIIRWGGDLEYSGKGNLKHCESTYLFIKVLVIVIVCLILAFAQQYWAIPIVAVLMVAALVVDYAVIRPMVFNMWNKLQRNMQTIDQFRESGVQAGIQGLSPDGLYIPDRFDLNANGLWGLDSSGKPKDHISRFAFYYNERLKFIKPPDNSAYDAFKEAMKNLLTNSFHADASAPSGLGINPFCTGTKNDSVLCDPVCTGISRRPGANTQANQRNRGQASLDYVPAQCKRECTAKECPPVSGTSYYLLYDPTVEMAAPNNPLIPKPETPEDPSNAYRFRLGHDDEIGKAESYDPGKATGIVFPMLNKMDNLPKTRAFGASLDGLSDSAKSAGLKNTIDSVSAMEHLKADDSLCALDKDSTDGFYWKKGSDRYCSGDLTDPAYAKEKQALDNNNVRISPTPKHWPYYQCTYMFNAQGEPMACQDGTKWPQDRLDSFVYELSRMVEVYNYIKNIPGQQMAEGTGEWFSQVASIMAPQCSIKACQDMINSCKDQCTDTDGQCKTDCNDICQGAQYPENNQATASGCDHPKDLNTFVACTSIGSNYAGHQATCNPQGQGYMFKWMYDLNNWANLLVDQKDPINKGWLNQSFGSPSDLCSGKIQEIGACLFNHKTYVQELQECKSVFPPTTLDQHGTTAWPQMPAPCIKVIRLGQKEETRQKFFIPIPPQIPQAPEQDTIEYLTNEESYKAIEQWVKDNWILKQAVDNRYNYLFDLYKKALGAYYLFVEGEIDFGNFLRRGGPAEALLKARISKALSLRRLPGFAIYGWKDSTITHRDGVKNIGRWHLSRMEVLQKNDLPKVHSWQRLKLSLFFGLDVESCYEFRDGFGDVWTRATKWDDQSTGGIAKFFNNIPIWNFRYGNPHTTVPGGTTKKDIDQISNEAIANPQQAIEKYCVGKQENGSIDSKYAVIGKGIGLTQDTREALLRTHLVPYNIEVGNTLDEAQAYQDAFMINIDPRRDIPEDLSFEGSKCQPPQDQASNTGKWCKELTDDYWKSCCEESYNRTDYRGFSYGGFCQQTNKARCQQNMKNAELRSAKDELLKCFYTVNALLNQGVKSASGAEYWVPSDQPYHEHIKFHTSKEAEDYFKSQKYESDTIHDPDLFNE